MTTQIELHDAYVQDDRIIAEYTVYDEDAEANVTQPIRPSILADFILEERLNWLETEPGLFVELGVTMFMLDNLRDMIKLYLERNLAA